MSRLSFDPSADIVKHDPPRKPLDPSRPIRRAPGDDAAKRAAEYAASCGVHVASETDPA